MTNEKRLYPAVERIYRLKDLEVPPENYGLFLNEVTRAFIEIVDEKNQSRKNMAEDIEFNVLGELKSRDLQIPQDKNGAFCILERTEHLIQRPHSPYGRVIPVSEFGEAIPAAVCDFSKALNIRYPTRERRMPESDFWSQRCGRKDRGHLPYHNVFRLNLRMFHASLDLVTEVTLRDYGSVHQAAPVENRSLIPAIQIKAERTMGDSDLQMETIKRLESLVGKYYKADSVTFNTSAVVDGGIEY